MSDTERQGSAALSPSDLAGIKARAGELSLPYCVPALRAGIRHLGRNCEVECPEHGDDLDGLCREPGRYDGEALAQVLNAVPALLADLARARDAVTRVRELALGWFTEEYLTSIPDRIASPETRLRRGILAALDADAAAGGEQT